MRGNCFVELYVLRPAPGVVIVYSRVRTYTGRVSEDLLCVGTVGTNDIDIRHLLLQNFLMEVLDMACHQISHVSHIIMQF